MRWVEWFGARRFATFGEKGHVVFWRFAPAAAYAEDPLSEALCEVQPQGCVGGGQKEKCLEEASLADRFPRDHNLTKKRRGVGLVSGCRGQDRSPTARTPHIASFPTPRSTPTAAR